jgi:hypothetical protein
VNAKPADGFRGFAEGLEQSGNDLWRERGLIPESDQGRADGGTKDRNAAGDGARLTGLGLRVLDKTNRETL